MPDSSGIRDGKTLHGTVVKVLVTTVPDTCPVLPETPRTTKTSLIFLDESLEPDKENLEAIPYSDIEAVRDFIDLPEDSVMGLNVFENYNDPVKFRGLRSVPVDSVFVDTCCSCRCIPFEADLAFDLNIDIDCVEREFAWFFAEVRAAYVTYSDNETLSVQESREGFPLEVAAGARFGNMRQWGLGLVFNTGIKAHNSFKGIDYGRPTLMLHGRWHSQNDRFLGLCMRPFIYGQLGFAVDELSLELMDFSLGTSCENCKRYIQNLSDDGIIPEVDFSIPISFGIGAGIDIPVTPVFDISADLGFRSIAFGESAPVAGFTNVPSLRRLNMMILRFGLTF